MKTNKDVRATLCLGIYTTWRNKTYIVRGIAKSFHLGLSKRNLYWIAGSFLLRPPAGRRRKHSQGKYERIITFTPSIPRLKFD